LKKDDISELQKAAEWLIHAERHTRPEQLGDAPPLTSNKTNNQKAVHEINKTSAKINALSSLFRDHPEEIPSDLLLEIESHKPTYKPTKETRLSQTFAACFLLFLATCLVVFNQPAPTQYYSTSSVEQRVLKLEDGSKITLNANTSLKVLLNSSDRRIELIFGEAYFEVAEHKDWPFVVSTASTRFEALGTEFNIKYRSERVKLTVTEGVVQLHNRPATQTPPESKDRQRQKPELVKARQSAVISDNRVLIHTLEDSKLAQSVSWKDGIVVFDNAPLEEIISEMNNYIAGKVVLMDEDVGKVRSGGVYKIGDENTFILAMEQTLPIKVVRATPYLTLLYHRP
jgi:transmembrane sensor